MPFVPGKQQHTAHHLVPELPPIPKTRYRCARNTCAASLSLESCSLLINFIPLKEQAGWLLAFCVSGHGRKAILRTIFLSFSVWFCPLPLELCSPRSCLAL